MIRRRSLLRATALLSVALVACCLCVLIPLPPCSAQVLSQPPAPNPKLAPLFRQPLVDGDLPPMLQGSSATLGKMRVLLDTGADAVLLLDSSFIPRLGPVLSTGTINSTQKSTHHRLGHFQIGSLQLHDLQVATLDFSPFAPYVSDAFKATAGHRMFRDHVLVFDFAGRQLSAFKEVPAGWQDARQTVLLPQADSNLPSVLAVIADSSALFAIDTGNTGSISIKTDLFDLWVKAGVIQEAATTAKVVHAAGETRIRGGQFTTGSILGQALAGVQVESSPHLRGNLLGISFLRRFNFVLDFPRQRLLYQQRPHPTATLPTERLLSARLVYRDGSCFVERMKPGSPVGETSLQAGDEIIRLQDLTKGRLNAHSVYIQCNRRAAQGQPIHLTFLRNGREQPVEIPTAAPEATQPPAPARQPAAPASPPLTSPPP